MTFLAAVQVHSKCSPPRPPLYHLIVGSWQQSVSELERQSEENLEMTSLTLASVLAAALTAVYSSRAKKTKKMQTPVHKSTAYNWIWMLYINPVGFSIWIWITLTFPQCCLAAIQRQGCSLRQHNVLAASYEFQDLRVLTRQRSRDNLFVFRLNLRFFDKTPLCKQLGVASCWWRQSWLTLWAGWSPQAPPLLVLPENTTLVIYHELGSNFMWISLYLTS